MHKAHSQGPRWALRAFGPPMSGVGTKEMARVGLGIFLALGLIGLFVLSPQVDLRLGLYLIPTFGSTCVMVFAVPNSPLAQPWPLFAGSVLAALIGVAVSLVIAEPVLRVALAVGLAAAAMMAARALHPPAGAIAMTAALNPDMVGELGFRFALMPVATAAAVIILLGMIYAPMTGRRYPLRQLDEVGEPVVGSEGDPMRRLGLSEADLIGILEGYRQTLNLGVADLARLLDAAAMTAATHQTGPITAADIMSRDLVSVGAHTPLDEVAELFSQYAFTSLPVVEGKDRFLGIIFQLHLIRAGQEEVEETPAPPLVAWDIMSLTAPQARPETPVAALLPLLGGGEGEAVAILDGERIVGIVTRTDLIAALARQTLLAAG